MTTTAITIVCLTVVVGIAIIALACTLPGILAEKAKYNNERFRKHCAWMEERLKECNAQQAAFNRSVEAVDRIKKHIESADEQAWGIVSNTRKVVDGISMSCNQFTKSVSRLDESIGNLITQMLDYRKVIDEAQDLNVDMKNAVSDIKTLVADMSASSH